MGTSDTEITYADTEMKGYALCIWAFI